MNAVPRDETRGDPTQRWPATAEVAALQRIPRRYDCGMTIQITIRLPDGLVAFVDALVADGVHTSRADAVAQALTREQRRRTALRDAEILARAASVTSANATDATDAIDATDATDVVNEMDALADFAAVHPAALDA